MALAEYQIPTLLSIPGLNFSVVNMVGAGYYNQQPLGLWLNLMTFTGLPVGDFMVMTPLQTFDGSTLWNGLAGVLGFPAPQQDAQTVVTAASTGRSQ